MLHTIPFKMFKHKYICTNLTIRTFNNILTNRFTWTQFFPVPIYDTKICYLSLSRLVHTFFLTGNLLNNSILTKNLFKGLFRF